MWFTRGKDSGAHLSIGWSQRDVKNSLGQRREPGSFVSAKRRREPKTTKAVAKCVVNNVDFRRVDQVVSPRNIPKVWSLYPARL